MMNQKESASGNGVLKMASRILHPFLSTDPSQWMDIIRRWNISLPLQVMPAIINNNPTRHQFVLAAARRENKI